MNDKEKIEVLKEHKLLNEQRINDLFQQNEQLEYQLFNYKIWVVGLSIVILILIMAVNRLMW